MFMNGFKEKENILKENDFEFLTIEEQRDYLVEVLKKFILNEAVYLKLWKKYKIKKLFLNL